MKQEKPKMPNPNAVKELRDRFNKRKEERKKQPNELVDVWKKKTPTKKIAKEKNNLPDAEA